MNLNTIDAERHESKRVLSETSKPWYNLHDDFHCFSDTDTFIWSSERTGFRHLYLYDLNGNELSQLTSGDWVVTNCISWNDESGEVYFSATKESPIEKHTYCVNIHHPGKVRKITTGKGWHLAALSKKQTYMADVYSNHGNPSHPSTYQIER